MPTLISMPEKGSTRTIAIEPGKTLKFSAGVENATFSRPEAAADGQKSPDLTVRFENDATLVLKNFFAPEGDAAALPALELADGAVISGEAFLAGIDPDFDLSTAAGPSGATLSGGLGDFSEGAGDLLAGVERFGSLGTEQFGGRAAATSEAFSVAALAATDAGPEPGMDAGGGPIPGPGKEEEEDKNDNTLKDPHSTVKAALLGVDAEHNPIVTVPLLGEDGKPLEGPFNQYAVSIEGLEGSAYTLAYDPSTGLITISLKQGGQPADSESFTVRVGDAGFVLNVGSSAGDELSDVDWPDDTAGVFAGAWAGSTGSHQTGGVFSTPQYDAEGAPLHLQYRDSSLTARADAGDDAKKSELNVDLSEGGGSVLISNEGQLSDITVQQKDSVLDRDELEYLQYGTSYTPKDYDASVSATLIAKGEGASNAATVAGGDLTVAAGGDRPAAGADADEARLSAVYAMEGGEAALSADNVTITAASAGFADGAAPEHGSTVTGIRSEGGGPGNAPENPEEQYEYGTKEHVSTVTVSGDTVTVGVTASGEAGDHASSTYAAVAATEQGQVHLTGTEDVAITVDVTAAGDAFAAAGVYGVFSGYGLGQGDKTLFNEFREDPYSYKEYERELYNQYLEQKTGYAWHDDEAQTNQHLQSEVNIVSGGDVTVSVDLGEHGATYAPAAGIMTHYGDVNISAQKDITVSVRSGAEHKGDVDSKLSALTIRGGVAAIEAEGDVTFSLDAAGSNLAVVNLIPPPLYETMDDRLYSSVSGKNVSFTGKAGYEASSFENHIEGISTANGHDLKLAGFAVDAQETFTIDVSALSQGGATSATGILAAPSERSNVESDFLLAVNAKEMHIIAKVESAPGAELDADSRATGILVEEAQFYLHGYDGDPKNMLGGEQAYSPEDHGVGYIPLLSINAEGGRYATGIEVRLQEDQEDHYHWYSQARIYAKEIEIEATSGAAYGQSSASYGVNAVSADYDSVHAYLRADSVDITVTDANEAVGLRAVGEYAEVTLTGTQSYEEGRWGPVPVEQNSITVTINCTVTGSDQLRGIAIEALQGGHVSIDGTGREHRLTVTDNSTIELTGDLLARDGSAIDITHWWGTSTHYTHSTISIDTDEGHDRIAINGNLTAQNVGEISIATGGGNDLVSINGNITATGEADSISIDAGEGDDIIMLSGKISGNVGIDAGSGHDLLVLSAPDVDSFNEWYQGWLQDGGLYGVSAESLIVHGVGVDNQNSIDWLLEMAEEYHIDVQVFGPEVDLTMVSDVSQFADGFALDGTAGDHDMLYVRYDSEQGSLDPLGDALANGSIKGVEHLLVDMANGKQDSVDLEIVDTLFSGIRATADNSDAKVILRVDADDNLSALTDGGWQQAGDATMNGVTYSVYTHGNDDDADMLYVQTITGM